MSQSDAYGDSPKNDSSPSRAGSDTESQRQAEQLSQALSQAGLVSDEQLQKAAQQKRRTGKSLVEILRQEVHWRDLKRAIAKAIHSKDLGEGSLSELLLKLKWIDRRQLAEAQMEAGNPPGRLGRLLVNQAVITEEQLSEAEKQAEARGHTLWRSIINLGYATAKQISDALRSESENLGEFLLSEGKLTQQQLDQAIQRQQGMKETLPQALVNMGALSHEELAGAFSKQLGIAVVDLDLEKIDYEAADLIPESVIVKFRCLPTKKLGNVLNVAFADPDKISPLLDVGLLIGIQIQPLIASERQISREIEKYIEYRRKQAAEHIETQMHESETLTPSNILALGEIIRKASATELVNDLIARAARSRATDIHFDPQDAGLRVRFRIDGLLHDIVNLPAELTSQVTTRLKILGTMDITRRRRAQDGHAHMEVNGREYDIRISASPTNLGEKIVLRLLTEESIFTGLSQLGLEPKQLDILESLIARPWGLILATGPVGCGKTTTLYAALNQVNILTKNVMTIEDPVEYKLPGTNQVQVDYKVDFDFAEGLRALLRQDPDIIMVGEIRDDETARIAVRAAMTGVLVPSTLHANDAAAAVGALVNHNIPRFLVSASLIGTISQRLVRTVCPQCKEQYKPDQAICVELGMTPEEAETATLSRGRGCQHCLHTGYFGRTGLFEVLPITEELQRTIVQRGTVEEIRKAAIAAGMQTLYQSGLAKVRQGITTPEQVLATTMFF